MALSRQVSELENDFFALEQEIEAVEKKHYQDNQNPYRLIFTNVAIPLVVVDHFGTILLSNEAALKFLKIPPEAQSPFSRLNFKSLLDFDSKRVFTKLLLSMRQKEHEEEVVLSNHHGDPFTPKFQRLTLNLDSGTQDCFLISFERINYSDISSQMMRLHIMAFDQIKEGIIITDQNHTILRVNQAFCDITGYKAEEALGKTPGLLSSGRHSKRYYDEMWEHIRQHGWWNGEIWNKNKAGLIYPEWLVINRIWDRYSRKLFYIAIFSDITGRKEEQHRLDRLAFFDRLTGLPNRESLQNFVENLTLRGHGQKHQFAMLFLDLDKFKEVNDRFGHAEGDSVLQLATQRIVANIRDSDFAARVGGDEFVIILSRLREKADVQKVVNNLLTAISKPFQVGNNRHFLSASIGIAMFPEDGREQGELLRKADLAMYRSKIDGRNRYYFYERGLDDTHSEISKMQAFVRDSITAYEDNIVIHYQPLYRPQSPNAFHEFECLVRLKKDNTLIYPDSFIEASEHSGLILPFGLAIFKKICSDITACGMPNCRFAVNLSAKQFESESLFESLKSIAESYGLALNQFNFEVTETAVTLNILRMESVLQRLRKDGCEILLDDFGTGYASLSMLKDLPVDIVKIDRRFIWDLELPSIQEMVSAMIYMAKALKLKVVCEGVETQAQFDWLSELHVDYIQGYLISKPKPLNEWIEYF